MIQIQPTKLTKPGLYEEAQAVCNCNNWEYKLPESKGIPAKLTEKLGFGFVPSEMVEGEGDYDLEEICSDR